MKRHCVIVSFIMACLIMMSCEESGKNVFGSRDHDIQSAYATAPQILADGVSTTEIVANVRDKEGLIAPNMKVRFETTLGSIDEYATSNYSGEAAVILTSVASDTDLTAKITAIVLDTTFSPSAKKTANSYTVSLSAPDFNADRPKIFDLKKASEQQDYRATIYVKFLGVTIKGSVDETVLPADGISRTKVQVEIRETTSYKAVKNKEINVYANYGSIQGGKKTDENGYLDFYLVADEQAGNDTLRIEFGNKLTKKFSIQYINPKLTLTPRALQVPADGESRIQIIANLKSHRNTPIIGAEIKFSSTAGVITESAITDGEGNASVNLIASTVPDAMVRVIARFYTLRDTAIVAFVTSSQVIPNSIILSADPNFIWVKATGNIDQTIISATVLGVNNQPLGNDIKVKFYIVNSPGGGESIEPSAGSPRESNVIPTVNGIAKTTIRSGTKSGTIQVRAELVDFPNIVSQTTNVVIRSGPPYMWVDPNNANHVIPHATLALESGKHNVCFANPIQDIHVTAYFSDVYNNPIENGTAVYFTTTGGFITSDAVTNDKGQTTVILQNAYPFPYLVSNDPNQLTSLRVPNPNNDSLMISVELPDFEYSEVLNSIGTYDENDGIAVILAYTWGQDQNGNHIKVWTIGRVIYSVGVKRFDYYTNKTELGVGETAIINIRVYDNHGNPVAAGSRLTVTTNAGELSDANLLPAAERYGFGGTFYQVTLTNTLKPGEDEPTTAVVKIDLDSPNGTRKGSIPIYLRITP